MARIVQPDAIRDSTISSADSEPVEVSPPVGGVTVRETTYAASPATVALTTVRTPFDAALAFMSAPR